MDEMIKKKLLKKFRKELDESMAERKFLDIKIEALSKIVTVLEKTAETKDKE